MKNLSKFLILIALLVTTSCSSVDTGSGERLVDTLRVGFGFTTDEGRLYGPLYIRKREIISTPTYYQ